MFLIDVSLLVLNCNISIKTSKTRITTKRMIMCSGNKSRSFDGLGFEDRFSSQPYFNELKRFDLK